MAIVASLQQVMPAGVTLTVMPRGRWLEADSEAGTSFDRVFTDPLVRFAPRMGIRFCAQAAMDAAAQAAMTHTGLPWPPDPNSSDSSGGEDRCRAWIDGHTLHMAYTVAGRTLLECPPAPLPGTAMPGR